MKMAEFSKWVENTRYKQFLLLPQCFQMTCTADSKNQGLFGKGLNLYQTNPGLTLMEKKPFEDCWKRTKC